MPSTSSPMPRRRSEAHVAQRTINTLSVVSERSEDLPLEPRFSGDSDRAVSRNRYTKEHGYGQPVRTQPLGAKDQRYMYPAVVQIPESLVRHGYCNATMPIPPDSPSPSITRVDSAHCSTLSLPRPGLSSQDSLVAPTTRVPASLPSNSSAASTRPLASSRSNSASTTSSAKQPVVPKSILKVTTVEQTVEWSDSRRGSASGSNKSSDNGSIAVSYDLDGKFVASEYDTSELSEREILKLQKKGINPALALEMKALRKGKSFGSLVGNSYVS